MNSPLDMLRDAEARSVSIGPHQRARHHQRGLWVIETRIDPRRPWTNPQRISAADLRLKLAHDAFALASLERIIDALE